ncbi:MAG: thiamine phosphate synthase [Bacteroidetes bacterium]|nr:MAG: thiamine phosphate synthase [Bacteroidota bacterium]
MTARSIPRLLLIGDRFSEAGRAEALCGAARAGVPWIQLRDHSLSNTEFERAALDVADRIRKISEDILISVNSRIGVVTLLGARNHRSIGIHLGWRGPSPKQARSMIPEGTLIGVSVHSLEQLTGDETDYYIWSPVFPTSSKPGAAVTGTTELGEASKNPKHIPVIALGGIIPENAADCFKFGARGIAVLSGIMEAADPESRTMAYLEAIKNITHHLSNSV